VPVTEPEERQTENAEVAIVEPEEKHTENVGTDVDVGGDDQLQKGPVGCSVLKELERAKGNLNRTTTDLAAIRASVDSLCNDIAKESLGGEIPGEGVLQHNTDFFTG
jgi:hypothetical protein